MLILTACQTATAFVETKPTESIITEKGADFCEIALPFYWSKLDTNETQKQAKIHNEKGKRLHCNWTQVSPTVP